MTYRNISGESYQTASKLTYQCHAFLGGRNICYHSKYTTVLLFIVYVTHLGSVLEGDTMPFTRQKIKVIVSSKVAFVTSLVQTTECPSPLLIDSRKQPGDRQASVCCVMSTHDMHHFHHVVSSSVPHKQVEWCMMYSCQSTYCRAYDNSRTGDNIQLILPIYSNMS